MPRAERTLWPVFLGVASLSVAAGLAAAAATGVLAPVDSFSLEHLMPARPSMFAFYGVNSNGQSAVALTAPHPHLAHDLRLVWSPFSRTISTVVVAVLCAYSVRRSLGWIRPLAWLTAFVIANLVAFVLQEYLRRPEIVVESGSLRYAVANYAASFPSGYAVRVVFIAVIVAVVWPRLRLPAIALTFIVLAAIVAGASHLLADVIAGTALAAGFALLADAAGRNATGLDVSRFAAKRRRRFSA